MPKPTLLQSLLGKPSQTYTFPPDKYYYSARNDFARAAVAPSAVPAPTPPSSAVTASSTAVTISDAAAATAIFGNNTSFPVEINSQLTTFTASGHKKGSGITQVSSGSDYYPSNEGIPLPSSSSPQLQITLRQQPDLDSSDSDDDSENDVFHTPFSSPPTSMFIDSPVSLLPSNPSNPHTPPGGKPPAFSSPSASSSSSSSSSSSHSAVSYSTPPTSDELHAALAALAKRPARPSRSKRASLVSSKSYTYTDEDWAKEVRWLVQPSLSLKDASKRGAGSNIAQPALVPAFTKQPKPRPRPRTVVSRPNTNHRMTALLEEDEDATDDSRASPTPAHAWAPSPSSPAPLSRSNSITSNSHDIRPASPASHTRVISLSSHTLDLPQFPATAAASTPATGYTTLTLPRASYRPEDPWRTLGSGHIDLPRDGRAQLSIVSIEVVRGAASLSLLPSGLRRRNSAPRSHKKHDLAGALALTSHKPPPSFVPNSGVLVQVHAVSLEGLDKRIVIDRISASEAGGKGAAGFIPGRGILAQHTDADANTEYEIHNPVHYHSLSNLLSAFVFPRVSSPSPAFRCPAYRAVRTYAASKPLLSSGSGTALVLRGQDGAGGLATLMLRAIGVNVIVQVDPSAVLGTNTPRRLKEVCARMRTWGVEGICVGPPLAVIHALAVDVDFVLDTVGGREIWDATHSLLACGTASRGPAQFTTIVGDVDSGKAVPTVQDHWRAGVRGLKRAMTISRRSGMNGGKSSKFPSSPTPNTTTTTTAVRTVNYTWVSCVADVDFEGGDVRDALAALLAMPALQHPPPDALLGLGGEYGAGRVLPFERTPEAFGDIALEGGGTAIIRVI
ncbi:hypothetical protein B0F90DRAFT_1925249 [Multifurca ochricompacta]|uniref:Uncharacterized protein n=1 Tax=Multifurca ochricompacta TaxID=376703 RepID=A0AAD4M5F7_9AGAM|nr:hypothetical protein B0F90DRAFT_1925249 [Multifurca ochricompacta]